MSTLPTQEGLQVYSDLEVERDEDAQAAEDSEDRPGDDGVQHRGDGVLETLRDAFVDAFNARDLDAVLGLVSEDVECPDIAGDGAEVLAEELESIWERSPAVILTRAFLEEDPCAVAWLPDDDGCWSRAAIVVFDVDGDSLGLVTLSDDTDAVERATADDPTGEELDEWVDWSEWDRGEEATGLRR